VLGANAATAATTNANVDVVAWAKTTGAYPGLTLEGSIIKPRNEWNAAYHGRPLRPDQVLNMPT
jgi:lipid-binding SYLF domain-containing protein